MRLREFTPDLTPFAPTRRWWVNTVSGDTIAVPEDSDHSSYLLDNQTQFGIDQHHKWSESDKLDDVAASHGWQPASYDSASQRVTVAFGTGTQKVLKRIVQQLKDQLPLAAVTVQVGNKSRELAGATLDHFLRNGRLPAR
jgi:hypothetical protein